MVAQGEGHWELLCYFYWQPIASWFPLAERSGLSPFLAILLGWGADRAGCVGVCDKPTHAVCFASSFIRDLQRERKGPSIRSNQIALGQPSTLMYSGPAF